MEHRVQELLNTGPLLLPIAQFQGSAGQGFYFGVGATTGTGPQGTQGWAPGAIFINSATGLTYRNAGTVTVASFVATDLTGAAGALAVGINDSANFGSATTVQDALDYLQTIGTLTSTIADPGSSGAISVLQSGICDLTSAGATTRTMAAPLFSGQQILINGKALTVADVVVTVATFVNSTGNNTLTFDYDATQPPSILLVGVRNGSNKRWRVVYADGVALSTV